MSGPLLPRLIGAVLLSMSGAIMYAWLARVPAALQAVPGHLMVFNAGLCFALAAAALLLEGAAFRSRRHMQSALGASTTVIAALSLAQHFLPVDLGIDLRETHLWLSGAAAHPGRMPAI